MLAGSRCTCHVAARSHAGVFGSPDGCAVFRASNLRSRSGTVLVRNDAFGYRRVVFARSIGGTVPGSLLYAKICAYHADCLANIWSWLHLHLRSLSVCQDCPYLYRIPLLGALPAGIIHYYHRYDWATDVTREVCVMVAAPCAIRGLTCCECMDRNVTARTCLANVHARDRGSDCRCTPRGRGIRVEGEIHILREGVCAVCTVPCARPVDDIGLGTMAPTRASFSTVCSTSCLVMGSSTLTATCGASNGTYYGMRRALMRHAH